MHAPSPFANWTPHTWLTYACPHEGFVFEDRAAPLIREPLLRLQEWARVGSWIGWVLVLACAVGPAAAAPATSSDEGQEAAALARLLRHPALRGARVGVSVVSLETGDVVVAHESDTSLVPASNQKLLVAATALGVWGPEHRFETGIYTEVPPDESGVVAGPLWVVGRGDPSLVSESLWRLAEEIRLRGVTKIEGGIAIDTSGFDGQKTHPDWMPLSRRAYHSPTGAFVVNYSSFRVEIRPAARAQQAARVSVVPEIPYFRVSSDAVTIPGNGNLSVDLANLSDGSGERVRVRGAMRVGQLSRTYWRSVTQPERYAAEVLRSQLETHGIRVEGPIRLGRAPEVRHEILEFPGETLLEMVRDMNKYSNNFIAEQLTKALGAERDGAPATWRSGVAVLQEYLQRANLLDAGTVIADGSGLSPRNRISPGALTRLIRYAVAQHGSGPEFLASLPLGGRDGTLEDRAFDPTASVRGKTGHLRRVASLSGVMPSRRGLLAYAVLINGAPGGRVDVDGAIDAFVMQVAGSVEVAPAEITLSRGSASE